MTALPLDRTRSLPARDSAPAHDWVPVAEAAKAIGVSIQHLRRLCETHYKPQGLAQRRSATVGGRQTWHVSAAAHPRLMRREAERDESGGSSVTALLAEADASKRAEATAKASVLVMFRRWRQSGAKVTDAVEFARFAQRAESQHGVKPTRGALYRWDKLCPASTDFDGIVAELLDRRGRPKGDAECCSDAAWSCFTSLYLQPQQRALRHCWDVTRHEAREQGWAWPSLSTVRRLVDERLDASAVCLAREGQDAWRAKFSAPIQQDPEAWAAGQCWEGDHTELDFFCRVIRGGTWVADRPWLTAWLDRRSRRLMGWTISEGGNASTVRSALSMALADPEVSVPEVVWIDNGKDFAARSVGGQTKSQRRAKRTDPRSPEAVATGMLNMLGIEPHFAQPYNHNGKARVERFFGTVHERFDKTFAAYAGHRSGMLDKREREARRKDVMSLPTLDEVKQRFAEWASWYNAWADHRIEDLVDADLGGRVSPEEFYRRRLPAKRTLDLDSLVILEQVFTEPVKVHKWGISIKIGTKTMRYGEDAAGRIEPALEPYVGSGELVYVSYDEQDLSRITVWDAGFRPIAKVWANTLRGGLVGESFTRRDLQAAANERREQKRRVKQRVDLSTLTMSDGELASRAAFKRGVEETRARLAEQIGQDEADAAPPLRLVTTPVDGQTPDLEREQMRLAAGAEHDAGIDDELDFSQLTIRDDQDEDEDDLLGGADWSGDEDDDTVDQDELVLDDGPDDDDAELDVIAAIAGDEGERR